MRRGVVACVADRRDEEPTYYVFYYDYQPGSVALKAKW